MRTPSTAAQLALPLDDVCQRWRDRRHSFQRRRDGGFNRSHYTVSPIPRAQAKTFVTKHHYSGSFVAELLSLGLFRADELVGVAVLGVPVRAEVLTRPFPTLEPYRASAELSRFVLLDTVPANAETFFLGRLFGHLRAATEVRGVLAFSDPYPRRVGEIVTMPGHIGHIYISHNGTYLGRSTPRTVCMLPNGTVLNDRAQAKVRARDRGWRHVAARLVDLGAAAPPDSGDLAAWLHDAVRHVGARSVRHGGCLRYAWALDRHVEFGMAPQPRPSRALLTA